MIVENLEEYPDKIEHLGDLTINCSIPANYIIKVKDGQLIINGDVGKKTSIDVKIEPINIVNGVIVSGNSNKFNFSGSVFNGIVTNNVLFGSGSITGNGCLMVNNKDGNTTTFTQAKRFIKVCGTVFSDVVIKSNLSSIECEDIMDNVVITTCNSSVIVGNVGDNVKIFTSNAEICAGNIGNNCIFTTKNSNIEIEKTLDNCNITTSNSGINIQQLGNHCSLTTKNANVSVKNIGKNNNIYTTNGNIKTNNTDNKNNMFYTTNGSIIKCR